MPGGVVMGMPVPPLLGAAPRPEAAVSTTATSSGSTVGKCGIWSRFWQ